MKKSNILVVIIFLLLSCKNDAQNSKILDQNSIQNSQKQPQTDL